MSYVAYEMSGDDNEGREINDKGTWQETAQKAWDVVSDVFSPDHTIVVDDKGMVHRFVVTREYPR